MSQITKKDVKPHVAGCGTRRQGKAYLVSNMKKYETKYPFGYFLYDPPILIDNPTKWGICPQGISYIQKDGVYHAVDWIGTNNYPNAADVLEEAFNVGGSGLVPLNQQIEKLTLGKSRRLLVHPHGWLVNNKIYKEQYKSIERIPHCFRPEGKQKHISPKIDEPCASLHWQVVKEGITVSDRYVQRKIGDYSYGAVGPIKEVDPIFQVAIIGWLPIDELHIVQSEDESETEKALKLLSKLTTDLPMYLTQY